MSPREISISSSSETVTDCSKIASLKISSPIRISLMVDSTFDGRTLILSFIFNEPDSIRPINALKSCKSLLAASLGLQTYCIGNLSADLLFILLS